MQISDSNSSVFSIPCRRRIRDILFWGGLATIVFTVIYGHCNNAAASSKNLYSMYTEWELSIPLVPWMIFPYISLNALFIVSFFTVKTTSGIKGFCLSMIVGALVAGFFFYFFPGKLGYERIVASDFSEIYSFMFSIDHPHNLFPSLHITYSSLGVLAMRQQTNSKWFHRILYGWLVLITASVVLVHQHHLFDVLTGAILASFLYRYVYLKCVHRC